jgi:hypothetical protein
MRARDPHSFVKHAAYAVLNRTSSKLVIRILTKLAVPMSALTSLKKNWIWAGLLLLCVLIAATAFIAPSKIGRMELREDARVAAARIDTEVKAQPQTLIGAFTRPELAAHVSSILHDLGYDHRVSATSFTTMPAISPSRAAGLD